MSHEGMMLQAQIPPEVQHKLMQFQEIQERIRALTIRRQQLEVELREVERTLDELKSVKDDAPIFKSAGRVLFKVSKEAVIQELNDRKETLELHIKTLEKQEAQARKRIEELRQDINQALAGYSLSSS
ncbi:MAG: prefoldin subunit beta [Thermoprotei archaeon]|nr:MAG: prefoldin subunit beta [Thermoprotei archaeon]RLF20796.1 MAG: prefoldin subunit beta [Thermoprotei archaeon]